MSPQKAAERIKAKRSKEDWHCSILGMNCVRAKIDSICVYKKFFLKPFVQEPDALKSEMTVSAE